MISKLVAMLGAAALLVAGSAAAAQSAAPLSLANGSTVRAGAELNDPNEIRGDIKWVLGALALGLIIWGVIELLDNDDEAFPNSP